MTTKFNVGDTVIIEGIIQTICVETTENKPIYYVRIKGAGTNEVYSIRIKEDVMKGVKKNEGIFL